MIMRHMKASSLCVLLIVSILFFSGCSNATEQIVGEWQTTLQGDTVTVIFNRDGTGTMVTNQTRRSFKYEINTIKDLITLDFIRENNRGLAIVQFKSADKMQILVGYRDGRRPINFGDLDSGTLITYYRVNH